MSNVDASLPPYAWRLTDAAAAVASGAITARALAEAQLARIAATDGAIEAWATLDPAHVRAEAARCDKAASTGPLRGIGIGVKDIIATRALPTGMGSPVFAGHRGDRDAVCVARILQAGGYVFGKTVTTEFAFMQAGKTRNPWNAAHTPGGSSSGSAAAVAAGHVAGALGTQTNGSVIRPAAYCGIVGFKPTLGAIPLAGAHLFSETLDTIGTFTRSVADAAVLARAVMDPAAITMTAPSAIEAPRLAVLAEFPWSPLSGDAAAALAAAVARLRQAGAHVQVATLPPDWQDAHRVHRTIMLYEGARNLRALQDRDRSRLSEVLNAALDEGRALADADYLAALAERERMRNAFDAWQRSCTAIVTPPAPAAAPAGLASTGDPACCTLWTLLGVPAITLPIGMGETGLPLGMQLAAHAGGDAGLLAVAAWCEGRLPFAGLV